MPLLAGNRHDPLPEKTPGQGQGGPRIAQAANVFIRPRGQCRSGSFSTVENKIAGHSRLIRWITALGLCVPRGSSGINEISLARCRSLDIGRGDVENTFLTSWKVPRFSYELVFEDRLRANRSIELFLFHVEEESDSSHFWCTFVSNWDNYIN